MSFSALLLDLGGTLVAEDHVIAHVPDALAALSSLEVGGGRKLELALVSDYTMPSTSDPAEIKRLVAEYVDKVRAFGLLPFFEPAQRRVTLSTQAGVNKPDAAIFCLALLRLGLEPDLDSAMFVTENATHVQTARALGMTAWRFGTDFTDWLQLPQLVAEEIGPMDADPIEEQAFVQALENNHAVSHTGELAPGQTHVALDTPSGPAVTRKRFSID